MFVTSGYDDIERHSYMNCSPLAVLHPTIRNAFGVRLVFIMSMHLNMLCTSSEKQQITIHCS